jgi:hypothetical protein
MLIELPWGTAHITYCTNIHAGETWDEISASLDAHVPRIRELISPNSELGLGLRLSGHAASRLVQPDLLERFREQLRRLKAYVFTVNAFPYGPFHGTRVKENVYQPDWRSHERLDFTENAARILADLLPEGGYGSISTVPGTFKPLSLEPGAVELMTARLLEATASLVHLNETTGRTLALALEPEPCCFLETVEETVAFFEDNLFAPAALARFGALTGLRAAESESALRRHLGVCYDVCHGAVEFEEPVTALRRLQSAGIAVPKIQLSAALRVENMRPSLTPRLEQFNTGVYLHQVVAQGLRLERYVDLPQAIGALNAGQSGAEWRVHCHVPVFLTDLGELGTTQDALVSTLRALREEAFSVHLEVETYTWDVLPDHLKTGSKADDIARELSFCLGELCNDSIHPRARFDRGVVAAGTGL